MKCREINNNGNKRNIVNVNLLYRIISENFRIITCYTIMLIRVT